MNIMHPYIYFYVSVRPLQQTVLRVSFRLASVTVEVHLEISYGGREKENK